MTFDEIVLARRSIRNFIAEPVPEEALQAILEAGWQAPSAQHIQNCHFFVVKHPEGIQRLQEAAYGQKQVGMAPVCLVVWAEGDRIMDCGRSAATADGSIALTMMMLKAAELGLGCCWLGHFNADTVKEILRLPEEAVVVAVTPLGYAARQPKEISRRPLAELVDVWE